MEAGVAQPVLRDQTGNFGFNNQVRDFLVTQTGHCKSRFLLGFRYRLSKAPFPETLLASLSIQEDVRRGTRTQLTVENPRSSGDSGPVQVPSC